MESSESPAHMIETFQHYLSPLSQGWTFGIRDSLVVIVGLSSVVCLGVAVGLFRKAREISIRSAARLEREVEIRTQELTKSERFMDSLIEYLPNMVFVKDAENLKFTRFNRAGEDLVGFDRSEMMGKSDYDFFPKEQADFFTAKDRAVLAGKAVLDIPEEFIETKHQGRRILHTRKIPLFGVDGKPEYLVGISEDITEKKKAETLLLRFVREQAALEERERANQRISFLAEASMILASSLDYHETLERLARVVLSSLADECAFSVHTEDGTGEQVSAIHKDLRKVHLIEELVRKFPVELGQCGDLSEVISKGKSCLVVDSSEIFRMVPSTNTSAINNEEYLQLIRQLDCSSFMIVPIRAREKIRGTITLVLGKEANGRRYNQQDLAFAEELGRRVGISIDNSFLYASAQRAIHARDEFLSIASHELKTPITSLKLQLQLTRRGTRPQDQVVPSPDRLARMLDVSEAQVRRLTTLIDDLLDVSRIGAGKLSFDFQIMDLAVLVLDTIESTRENFSALGSSISFSGLDTLLISGDRFRLEQVILNLFSNAAKYGTGKPVEVNLNRTDGFARLIVRDYGIGIPKGKLEKIFERFERAVNSSNFSGLGLGLYIAKEVIAAHRGKIYARSNLGHGSEFIVEIPIGV